MNKMKKYSIALFLGLIGITGHVYPDVTIELAKGELLSLSESQYEALKGVIVADTKIGPTGELQKVNKEGLTFVIDTIELIKTKNTHALKDKLKKLFLSNNVTAFSGALDAAAILAINQVLKAATLFINENISHMLHGEKLSFLKEILRLEGKHKHLRFFDKDRALLIAAGRGREEGAQLLIIAGADLNKKGTHISARTPLMRAASEGHKDIVKMFVKAGADLDLQDKSGATALILASKGNNAEIVALLIERGANIDIQDKSGNTALIWSTKKGLKNIAEKLIDAQADLNKQNKRKDTALMIATYRNHIAIVKLLLKKPADLNKQNKHGETALILATERDRGEIVELLVNAGADLFKRNNAGKTAFSLARDKKIIFLLKKAAQANS